MSRKKKLFLNTILGVLKQVVTVVCGFILPRYLLLYYGSHINGLVASINNFLSFISLLDLGVGSVIQANLYKPLAEKNEREISQIVKASEKFFGKLGCIFLVYILALCFVLPNIVGFDSLFSISLLLIISISSVVQYFCGMTYQLLLNADQKSYVQLVLQIITIVLNTALSIVLIKMGAPIHVVKLVTAIVFVLRPFGQMAYVHKHYKIDHDTKLVGEPIKQKWNGFSQHLASVVCQNIDVVVLTFLSSLKNVSIYSVYYNVTNGVEQIVMTAATGLESLFGNMIAKNENEQLLNTFCIVEWLTHTGVTIIFSITMITIVPFVGVYTRGIEDTNYLTPKFAVILVLAYGIQCLRVPYFRVIKAAGHFKETQNGAYISAGLNIFFTIALVLKYGLIGTAIGTLIALFYHTCYFVWYLKSNILKRKIKYFVKHLFVDIVIVILSYAIAEKFVLFIDNYFDWMILATKVAVIVIIISFLINILVYRKKALWLLANLNAKRK